MEAPTRSWLFCMPIVLVLFTSVLHADQLRFATSGAQPPFNSVDATGELRGFDIDLVKALCLAMQVKCTLQATAASELLAGLVSDQYDAVIATGSPFSVGAPGIDYTDPYYSSRLRFVAAKDIELGTTSRLAAVKGSAAAAHLADHQPAAGIELYVALAGAWKALKNGEVDAVLTGVHAGYDWLASLENMGYDYVGEVIDTDRMSRIVLRKQDQKLKQQINQSLKTLIDNGTFQHISRSHFPFSIY